MDVSLLIGLHMGALHPVEKILTVLLAFGPFVFLGFVIWWRKRQDEADENSAHTHPITEVSESAGPRPPVGS